jgi:hypothetical protein
MENHLHDHLDSQKSKLDHWVWNWVTKNLPRLAALMVFVGHVLPDDVLSCSSINDCLLQKALENEKCMFWKVNLEDPVSAMRKGRTFITTEYVVCGCEVEK